MTRTLDRRPRRNRLIATQLLTVALVIMALGVSAASQPDDLAAQFPAGEALGSHVEKLRDAAIALPLATVLGLALALRPRRKGTPPRSAAVIQTQIILAVIGALVMLVVGASLARAFGIVGVAGLIRYRVKVADPKDAGVMLSTLAVGLAAGVGLYVLAGFGAMFIMVVLWILESFEPDPFKAFALKVTHKEAATLQPQIEQLLRRQRARFDARTSSPEEICYDVQLPVALRTDRISNAILRLPGANGAAVEWDEKKAKG